MSYDLCQVRQAKHPFLLSCTQTRVYSIEELCYFLYHNTGLVDEHVIGEPLCKWLQDELGLERLAASLRSQLIKGEAPQCLIPPIFREIGYLPGEEARRFSETVTRLQAQPPAIRAKLYADALAQNGIYTKAIRAYQNLLQEQGTGTPGAQFYADVQNNLGSVYAAQYRYREASACYYQAWKTGKRRECLRRYLSTLPLFLEEEAYQKRLQEDGIDAEFARSVQERSVAVLQKAGAKEKAQEILDAGATRYLDALKEGWRKSAAG